MKQDEIIEMARQAGFLYGTMGESNIRFVTAIGHTFMHELEAFAKLVAAREREACASTCLSLNLYGPYHSRDIQFATLEDCAKAIRARGQE